MKLRDLFTWYGSRPKTEVKVSRAVAGTSGPEGSSSTMPRTFAGYAEEGYKKNCVAFRCINLITNTIAQVEWIASIDDTELDSSHPLMGLLSNPNPFVGAGQFYEAAVGFFMIAGNLYFEGVGVLGEDLTAKAPPREMYVLRPDRMTIQPGATGYPSRYIYQVGSNKVSYPVEESTGESAICHVAAFDPTDDLYGMSPLRAAAFSIDQHNAGGRWNNRLLQNSARPSGAVYQDSTNAVGLSEEEFTRFKKELRESYAGADNPGKVLLLEAGLRWQEMGLSPKDMDWIQAKDTTTRDICMVLGVPAMLVGVPGDNTYANYHEARLALVEDRVAPLASIIGSALARWLKPYFVKRDSATLTIEANLDSLPAIQHRRAETMKSVDMLTYLTVDEKRDLAGYDPYPGGDVILISSGQIPLGAEMPPEEIAPIPEEPKPPTEEEEVEEPPAKPTEEETE